MGFIVGTEEDSSRESVSMGRSGTLYGDDSYSQLRKLFESLMGDTGAEIEGFEDVDWDELYNGLFGSSSSSSSASSGRKYFPEGNPIQYG